MGTPVLTPGGPRPIEAIRPGDTVLTVSHCRIELARVLACSEVQPGEYVHIQTPSGLLSLTAEHPVAVGTNEFRVAGSISAGDRVMVCNGTDLGMEEVSSISRTAGVLPAFNLLVDRTGTYIAGGVLLHNKGCFLPDAPILLADGSSKPMGQIRAGDRVMAFRMDGSIAMTTVRNVIRRVADGYLVVTLEDIVLNVTAEHPFYVGNGTFQTIGSLKGGDTVFAFDGNGISEQRIIEVRRVSATVTVHNLQTDDPYTFFAAGIAVHNKGGGCFPCGTLIDTPEGRRPIETLAPGDTILASDCRNSISAARVESIFARRSQLVEVMTGSGPIRATAGHPFALADGGFCEAGTLTSGQNLLALEESTPRSTRVLSVSDLHGETTVFNLSVQRPHTFMAAGFLVHNKGGGGGFHSSSSHRSGGGSGGAPMPVPVLMFFGIIILYVIISKARSAKEDDDLDYCYPRAEIKPKADKTAKLADFIAKQDPVFAPGTLTETARSTFLTLQKCWQGRNYDPMKSLMMPDLFTQHISQIQGMIRNHEINMIAGLSINRIDLVNVRYTNKPGDREFTALVTATAQDYYIDDRTREKLRGDTSPAQFQEFWTFQLWDGRWLLREIEQTRESDALKDENFFEPFTDTQLEQVYGGTADQTGPTGPWLEHTTGRKAVRIERLLNFLYETDKLWDRQAMLNRAREIFTEVYLSRESGTLADSTASKMFPDVAGHLRSEMARWKAGGASVEYRNFCVRKVELILARNYNDRTRDEFVTRISAHAQAITLQNGTVARQDTYVMPFQEYWVFGRLDEQWKLKEILPPAKGDEALKDENVDEGSSQPQLDWFYSKKRTV